MKKQNDCRRNFYTSNVLQQFKKLNIGNHQKSWNSRNTYKKTTQKILKFCVENYNVQKIENVQNKHIRAFIENEIEKDNSLSYIKKEISGFRYYVNMLNTLNITRERKQCKFSADNQSLGIHAPKEFRMRTAISSEEYFNISDFAKSIKDKDTSDFLLTAVDLGVYFGCRSAEVFGIKKIQLENTLNQIKNNQPAYLNLDGTNCKGGRPRSVGPLNDKQKEKIKEIYDRYSSEIKYSDEYLLRNDEGCRKRLSMLHNIFSTNDFSDEHRKATRPEWDKSVSFHDLRRLFAKTVFLRCVNSGKDYDSAVAETAHQLGHGAGRGKELAKYYIGDVIENYK